MAIYHLEAKVVSRGTGRSAVAASAYLSCTNILNDYDGVRHDYTRKKGLVWQDVFLPEFAPAEWKDRGLLWNAVEENEKTKDSRLAREFVPALSIELTPAQWQELITDFIQNSFVAEGMCADVAIHDPHPPGHNPHAHIMLTVRPLDEQGNWQYKTEKEYLCVKDGEERGFTAAEFKQAQADGWEKQYQYKVGKKKVYMAPSAAQAQGYERVSKYPKSTKYGRQNPISERWNSEEQLVSYANQKKVYTEMIASRKDWCFAGLFADEGKSGTRADKRPEFNKMINDCLAGKIDYIITKSVSRFARNTVDCLDYVRMLKSKGIGVYFEEQQIDTLKTDSELYLVIYAGFAQSESESISKNITWSVRKKFEEGTPVFMYKRFLGYKKGADGEPEIVPSEAAIVERIFNLYLAGETVDKISKMMQAENYDIPDKTISFSKGMIMNMLSNERYCGDAILQKSVTIDCIEKKRKKNTGEAPMYYVQNNHPAIIDRVTFNKVQEELARRKTKTPGSAKSSITSTGKYSRYALTDVLICGNCGTRYRRVTWSRNGVKRIVWRCISRLDYGKKYCSDSPTIMEDKLQEAIVRAVNKFNEQDIATYKSLMRATISDALGLNGDP